MYACEMQICCYNRVKYFVGIKFHVYQMVTPFMGPINVFGPAYYVILTCVHMLSNHIDLHVCSLLYILFLTLLNFLKKLVIIELINMYVVSIFMLLIIVTPWHL